MTNSKPVLKEINIGKIGKLIITDKLQETIEYLHRNIGATEWSGILFYKLTKGSIKDLKNLEFTAEFLYPMNIGSHAYTEFDYNEDVISAYDVYEEAMNCSSGLVHSHHNMSTFFSGTDTSELKDNCKNFNYYLSLIVNFSNQYSAKVGFYSSSEVKTKLSLKDSLGKLFNKQIVKTEESILIGDLDIEIQSTNTSPQWLTERYTALKAKKAAISSATGFYKGYQSDLWQEDDFSRSVNYRDTNWNKKDENKTEQFIVALLNLDASKKRYGLEYSLKQFCALKGKDVDIILKAIDLNLEQLYCEVYPEDIMMLNFEKVCEEASNLLETKEKFIDLEIVSVFNDLLYTKAIGEETE